MPWVHGAASCSSVCAPMFTEDFRRSKSHTATLSVGLQDSYEIGTIILILLLIYTSRLSLEALERLSSFFCMSSTCQHQDLNLRQVQLRNPSFVPLDQTTWEEGLPLMHLSIYLKHATHLYLACAYSHLLTILWVRKLADMLPESKEEFLLQFKLENTLSSKYETLSLIKFNSADNQDKNQRVIKLKPCN